MPLYDVDGYHVKRGSDDALSTYNIMISVMIFFDVVMSFIFLLSIVILEWIRSIYRRQSLQATRELHRSVRRGVVIDDDPREHQELKALIILSICYFIALIVTLIFPSLFWLPITEFTNPQIIRVLKQMALTFEPSQGIFNFPIFLGNKVVLLKKSDPSLSTCQAISQIFCEPKEDPLIMTNMTLVMLDIERRRPGGEEEKSDEVNNNVENVQMPDQPISYDFLRQDITERVHGPGSFGSTSVNEIDVTISPQPQQQQEQPDIENEVVHQNDQVNNDPDNIQQQSTISSVNGQSLGGFSVSSRSHNYDLSSMNSVSDLQTQSHGTGHHDYSTGTS